MYKLDIPIEPKETAAIERRRNAETQRQSRIFNVKSRTRGVDVTALDHQVIERKARETSDKAREESLNADSLRYAETAGRLERQEAERRRELNRELNGFREREQSFASRREFDLNDPQALRKDKPARVCDADPRCGPSSLQRFEGEDLNRGGRESYQRAQTRAWLETQRAQRERERQDQKMADDLSQRKAVELGERATHLERLEREGRRALNVAILNYNRAQADEESFQREQARAREAQEDLAEISQHLNGTILTEDPSQSVSPMGPSIIITDRWKGMTPEQLADIYSTQERQRVENKLRRQAEAELGAEWARRRLVAARGAMAMEDMEGERERTIRQTLSKYNQQLATEQRAHQKYLEEEVYTNAPTGHYFTQFNTSSR